MAKFDFILGDDGRAKPVIPVTIFLTTEEEKAAMIEAAKQRTLRLMEWHPIKYIILDGTKAMSMEEKPAEGDMVLCTNGLEVWPDVFINGGFGGFFQSDDATAWMRMPAPYKPKEGGEA